MDGWMDKLFTSLCLFPLTHVSVEGIGAWPVHGSRYGSFFG